MVIASVGVLVRVFDKAFECKIPRFVNFFEEASVIKFLDAEQSMVLSTNRYFLNGNIMV